MGGICPARSVGPLSLDSLRRMALSANKELRMAEMREQAAHYEHRGARTKYLPRVSMAGTYQYTSRELSLLSDDQQERLGHLGTAIGTMAALPEGMAGVLDGVGAGLVDALHTDTRHAGVAACLLTQPLYMGGKIRSYDRITRFAEQMAGRQRDLRCQEVIVEVDETYWQIVALQSRRRLAESYLSLTGQLDHDVEQMIVAGLATRADGLSVKVRVNEAQVALMQVDNALALSRMKLCQLCGLELDTEVTLVDEGCDSISATDCAAQGDVQTAFANRPELDALTLMAGISREKVRVARAEFLPSVALTGGYAATYPSVFNSFERRMKGMWNVGLTVQIPLLTWGERGYKVKAARAEAHLASYHLEEVREKVELQVNQGRQKVDEATRRLRTAEAATAEADENLRHATMGMQEGVIPVSNVLEAQTAWVAAHATKITAQIDLRLADLYLRKATGTVGTQY